MSTAYTIPLEASEHSIKSVTVFKSNKAEIVRKFEIELKKGQTKIEIRGLSTSIDTQSVRVSGLEPSTSEYSPGLTSGNTATSLLDLVCTLGPINDENNNASETIRKLNLRRAALANEKAALEEESKMMMQYGQTLTGEHVKPAQMSEFLDSFVKRNRKAREAIEVLDEEILQIGRKIIAEENKVSSKRGTTRGEVNIVVQAEVDRIVELKLTYIVSDVKWAPSYELHAKSDGGKPAPSVFLHYCARVVQKTGEDWTNTTLTLSTVASDTVFKKIPPSFPVRIRPARPFFNNGGGFLNARNNNNNTGGGLFSVGPMGQAQQQKTVNPFGQPIQSQQQQATSIFGSTTGGGFGGGNNAPATGGLFGQAAQNQPGGATNATAGTGFGAFGNAQMGSLFGAPLPPASTSAPAPAAAVPAAAPTFGATLPAHHTSSLPVSDEDEFEQVEVPVPAPPSASTDATNSSAEPMTIVNETPVAMSFTVHGKSTVPSDGVNHQVQLAVLSFGCKVKYVVVPRVDTRVYLQCNVKNTSEYRLLPGPVSVILDDSYVSKTWIGEVNTGDQFDCTLGDDGASTQVTYSRTAKTVRSDGGTFAEKTNTTTYHTKIMIRNKHPFPLDDLIVKDVIHTADHDEKRVRIVLRTPLGLADAQDGEVVELGEKNSKKLEGLKVAWEKLDSDGKGGEKAGQFEWRWKVGAGEKVELESEWEVKVPAEISWVEAKVFGN